MAFPFPDWSLYPVSALLTFRAYWLEFRNLFGDPIAIDYLSGIEEELLARGVTI